MRPLKKHHLRFDVGSPTKTRQPFGSATWNSVIPYSLSNRSLILYWFLKVLTGLNAGNFNVYLSVPTDVLHDILRRSLLKMNGLAVPLHYRVISRFEGRRKPEHALVKQNTFLHVGSCQHGANSFRYSCFASHNATSGGQYTHYRKVLQRC